MAKPQPWPRQAEKERAEALDWLEEIARLAIEGRGPEAQGNPFVTRAIFAEIEAAALRGQKILREASNRE